MYIYIYIYIHADSRTGQSWTARARGPGGTGKHRGRLFHSSLGDSLCYLFTGSVLAVVPSVKLFRKAGVAFSSHQVCEHALLRRDVMRRDATRHDGAPCDVIEFI